MMIDHEIPPKRRTVGLKSLSGLVNMRRLRSRGDYSVVCLEVGQHRMLALAYG